MSGPCSATPAPTRSARCSAPWPRPAWPAARLALLAAITGLTAASEVVSFTRVIERTPPLRWLDMLGRRPAAPSGQQMDPGQAGTVAAPGARGAGPGTQAPVIPR